MKVGYYQFTVELGEPEKNINQVARAISGQDFDLLVLPELFATGTVHKTNEERLSFAAPLANHNVVQALLHLAQKSDGYLVGTVLELEGDHLYNTAVIAGPEGLVGTQRKRFPSLTEGYFTPGTASEVFSIMGVTIGVAICTDAAQDVIYEDFQRLKAQLICHPSNFIGEGLQAEVEQRVATYGIPTLTVNRLGNDIPNAPFPVDYVGESRLLLTNGTSLEQAAMEERLAIIEWSP